MNYVIEGELAQVVHLTLDKGEIFWASKGSLVSYDAGIDWSLKIPGGLSGVTRRVLSGEGVSLTRVVAQKAQQDVILSANEPGKIQAWDLSAGAVLTTRGAFLAAWGEDVHIDVRMAKRAGAAVFGGAGLFLQRLSGQGMALIHGAGDFMDRELRVDETWVVSTGNLVAFSDSVDYAIQKVGGVRRTLFGGEGLFMTRLTGPGRVLMQSLKRKRNRK